MFFEGMIGIELVSSGKGLELAGVAAGVWVCKGRAAARQTVHPRATCRNPFIIFLKAIRASLFDLNWLN